MFTSLSWLNMTDLEILLKPFDPFVNKGSDLEESEDDVEESDLDPDYVDHIPTPCNLDLDLDLRTSHRARGESRSSCQP